MSKKPKHDFENVRFIDYDDRPAVPSQRRKSKYTKSAKQKAQELGERFAEPYQHKGLFKQCMRCRKFEDEDAMSAWKHGLVDHEAKEKFRYCGGCKSATYCSKECSLAHWPDHRLTCSGYDASVASSKKDSSKNNK